MNAEGSFLNYDSIFFFHLLREKNNIQTYLALCENYPGIEKELERPACQNYFEGTSTKAVTKKPQNKI